MQLNLIGSGPVDFPCFAGILDSYAVFLSLWRNPDEFVLNSAEDGELFCTFECPDCGRYLDRETLED
jgi:hypothetical protein